MEKEPRQEERYGDEPGAGTGIAQNVLIAAAVVVMLATVVFFSLRVLRNDKKSGESLDTIGRTISENAAILEKTSSFASASEGRYDAIDEALREIRRSLDEYAAGLEKEGAGEKFSLSGEQLEQLKTSVRELSSRTESLLEESTKEREDTHRLIEEILSAEGTHADVQNTQSEQIIRETKDLQENLSGLYGILQQDYSSLEQKMSSLEKDFSSLFDKYSRVENAHYQELAGILQESKISLASVIEKEHGALASLAETNRLDITATLNARIAALENAEKGEFEALHREQAETGGRLEALSGAARENTQNILHSLDDKYSAGMEKMDELSLLVSSAQEQDAQQLTQLSQNFLAGMESQFLAAAKQDEDARAQLLERLALMEGKIDASFTSVSSGKDLLANALLTKGVDVLATYDKDANQEVSFADYARAISGLQQTITLEDIPAVSVNYVRHHHIDANGNVTGAAVFMDAPGGCFTAPYYHVHGQECCRYYTLYRYGCENSTTVNDSQGNPFCSVCQRPWKKVYDDGEVTTGYTRCRHELFAHFQEEETERSYDIVCGKSTSVPVGYAPACGYRDGQILRAELSWELPAGRTAARMVRAGSFLEEDAEGKKREENAEEPGCEAPDSGLSDLMMQDIQHTAAPDSQDSAAAEMQDAVPDGQDSAVADIQEDAASPDGQNSAAAEMQDAAAPGGQDSTVADIQDDAASSDGQNSAAVDKASDKGE